MPNTNDSHGESKIIFENEDWLIVEPFDYDSYVYNAPEGMKSSWNTFRDGDVYFIVDKNSSGYSGFKTYMMYKDDDGIEYYNWNGKEIKTKKRFVEDFSDEITQEVNKIIGNSELYDLLVKVVSGELVSSRMMENSDDHIYGFKYNQSNPAKSLIRISFSDMEEYASLFNLDDDDKWFMNIMLSRYDSYEFHDSYTASDEWNEGYLIGWFNEDNRERLKEIVSLVAPQFGNLENEEDREGASKLLDEMFPNEISEIYDDWVSEYNACKNRAGENMIRSELCDVFNNYGIIEKTCFRDYYTTAGILLSLYKQTKDTTLNLFEVLSSIVSRKEYGGWYEYMYETGCYDFDDESFNRWVTRQLDAIYEKLEDSDQFSNVKEYSRIFNEITKKYPIDTNSQTKYGKVFKVIKIEPKTNKIHVAVSMGNGKGQERSYTEEEFNNFIVSPELFESKKIQKKY